MLISRRQFTSYIAGALLGVAVASRVHAQGGQLKPNYDYKLIEPQPIATGDRVEVVEFFWYGCPFCYQLQAPLESWLKRKPADVELRRIPAIFRESWVPHARLFYTIEALNELDRLHQAAYRAIHVEKDALNSADATAAWATRNGVEPARWLAVYNSPETDRKIEASRQQTRAYGISGTPSLIVDGRYLTSSGMSESVPGVVGILEGLIVMARDRRGTGR